MSELGEVIMGAHGEALSLGPHNIKRADNSALLATANTLEEQASTLLTEANKLRRMAGEVKSEQPDTHDLVGSDMVLSAFGLPKELVGNPVDSLYAQDKARSATFEQMATMDRHKAYVMGVDPAELKACSVAFKPVEQTGVMVGDSCHVHPDLREPRADGVVPNIPVKLGDDPKPLQISIQWKCGCCVKVPFDVLDTTNFENQNGTQLTTLFGPILLIKCDMANGCYYDPAVVDDALRDASQFRELDLKTIGLLGDARWSVEER